MREPWMDRRTTSILTEILIIQHFNLVKRKLLSQLEIYQRCQIKACRPDQAHEVLKSDSWTGPRCLGPAQADRVPIYNLLAAIRAGMQPALDSRGCPGVHEEPPSPAS